MSKYLITGIAGSGKSTFKGLLEDQGYQTFDIDDGLANWINRKTKQAVPYSKYLAPMTRDHDWTIDKGALKRALNANDTVIICGSAHDLYTYISWFDRVFLLSYPSSAAIKERLASRTNNDYGKAPGELEDILGYWKAYEHQYVSRGSTVLDCTSPLNENLETIIHDFNS